MEPMLAILALAVFAGLLLYAALTDLAALTIPNAVSIALATLFIPFALAANMPLAQIGLHIVFGFGILVVGFLLFQANVFGGGDAKLLAAAAIWTGFGAFAPFALWTVLAGGLIAVALSAARSASPMFAPALVGAPAFVSRLLTPKTGVPYAVAIMAGGFMSTPSIPLLAGALTLL